MRLQESLDRGRDVAGRDLSAWGRTFRAAIDDASREWSVSAAEPRCSILEPDVQTGCTERRLAESMKAPHKA